ncbi:MAG: secondary thiamine-phosphate synthase enzyme YjbQ [Candidatus Acidiferrales bacterium]
MTRTPNPSGASEVHMLTVRTTRRTEWQDVAEKIAALVRDSSCVSGICHLYVPHTTAGVIVNEGYDPAVAHDIEAAFDRLVPRVTNSAHAEGNSDSHIKTALVGSSESIWIAGGKLALGRWQATFFAEFDGPRSRELRVKIVPDALA